VCAQSGFPGASRIAQQCQGHTCLHAHTHNTLRRLEANALRSEGATMQARIEAMKQQQWVDSDEFVKARGCAAVRACVCVLSAGVCMLAVALCRHRRA
jgi:hypothetical protein